MTKKNSPTAKNPRNELAIKRIPKKETNRNPKSPATVANKNSFDSCPSHSPFVVKLFNWFFVNHRPANNPNANPNTVETPTIINENGFT